MASTDDGVLILSEFAGASEELREAIMVNPYNVGETARGIKQALQMSYEERRERMEKLKERVKENNLARWRDRFMEKWLG